MTLTGGKILVAFPVICGLHITAIETLKIPHNRQIFTIIYIVVEKGRILG